MTVHLSKRVAVAHDLREVWIKSVFRSSCGHPIIVYVIFYINGLQLLFLSITYKVIKNKNENGKGKNQIFLSVFV